MSPRFHLVALSVAGVFLSGCRSETPQPLKPSVRTQEANKQHIEGTSEVLRNYRYGETPKQKKRNQ